MGDAPDSPRVALARIIGSAIVGTLLLGAGAFVCWWGLGQERATADAVDRLLEAHVVVSPEDGPLPENEGRALYISGPVTVSEPLRDEATGLRLDALVLHSEPQKLVFVTKRAGENDSRVIRTMEWQHRQVEGLESIKRLPQEVRIGQFVVPEQQLDALAPRVGEIDQDADIIVHCKMGGRSAKAAHFLRDQGYEKVRNMWGGTLAWSEQVDPSMPKY